MFQGKAKPAACSVPALDDDWSSLAGAQQGARNMLKRDDVGVSNTPQDSGLGTRTLLGTSATLVVTGALLVGTRS